MTKEPPKAGKLLHDLPLRAWFRGSTVNRRPSLAKMTKVDDMVKSVLHGWEPEQPFITPDTKITAFGSCFAANVSNWLAERNFRVLTREAENSNAYVVSMGEGMVNSFAIRQQFEWAWENQVFDQPLWHGYKAEDFGYDEEVRLKTKEIFDDTDVFILTFGLSEVWYDEPTGNVFWRTVPKDAYDPSRHKFRVSSVEENRDNIDAIYQLIRKHRPDAKIIMTLSPVPLIATFRDVSCISANAVSKATLRVALDEVLRDRKDEGFLHYWPSYELVMDVLRQPFQSDNRHPVRESLDYIMTLFEHVWCEGDDKPDLTEAWVIALAASGQLGPLKSGLLKKRNFDRVERVMSNNSFGPSQDVDAERKALVSSLIERARSLKGSKAS